MQIYPTFFFFLEQLVKYMRKHTYIYLDINVINKQDSHIDA